MSRWFLIVIVGLLLFSLGLAGFEWWNGRFPTSLSGVFILIALLLQRPPASQALGAASKKLSWACLIVAMTLVAVNIFWLRDRGRPGVRIGDPGEAVVRAAAEATGKFHSAVSEKRYADVCRVAQDGAFRGVTELRCEEFLSYMRERLGPFVDAEVRTVRVETNSDTPHVDFDSESRYENQQAQEHFGWLIDVASCRAVLASYSVEAEALSK
jgi:hypothetical protein